MAKSTNQLFDSIIKREKEQNLVQSTINLANARINHRNSMRTLDQTENDGEGSPVIDKSDFGIRGYRYNSSLRFNFQKRYKITQSKKNTYIDQIMKS